MYYSIFEGVPHAGKEELAGEIYEGLLPKVKQITGFREDGFSVSPHVSILNVSTADEL